MPALGLAGARIAGALELDSAGCRPLRAAAWLVLLLVLDTVVFTLHPPRAIEPDQAPRLFAPV